MATKPSDAAEVRAVVRAAERVTKERGCGTFAWINALDALDRAVARLHKKRKEVRK